MKKLIKKLLAWVLRDDLAKLRRTIRTHERLITSLDAELRSQDPRKAAEEKTIMVNALVARKKWPTNEKLLAAHHKAVVKLERAYQRWCVPQTMKQKLKTGTVFHAALEAEQVLWRDIDAIAKVSPPLEAAMLQNARQQWSIDFENPVV